MRRSLAALSSLLLLAVAGCTFQSHVITVTLKNQGPVEARNIEFKYPGGSFGVASLAPGGSYEYKIKPFFNGGIEIEYQYGQAKVRSTISHVEKDQMGQATVIISDIGVKWDGFRPTR